MASETREKPMRTMTGLVAGLAMLSGLAAAPAMVQAKTPPRVPAYSCSALSAAIGASKVWQTQFEGNRPSPLDFFREHPRMEHYAAAPCFKTEAACKAWLYWIQSDWPLQNNYRPCRRGIRY
jgi:hypothetical protein